MRTLLRMALVGGGGRESECLPAGWDRAAVTLADGVPQLGLQRPWVKRRRHLDTTPCGTCQAPRCHPSHRYLVAPTQRVQGPCNRPGGLVAGTPGNAYRWSPQPLPGRSLAATFAVLSLQWRGPFSAACGISPERFSRSMDSDSWLVIFFLPAIPPASLVQRRPSRLPRRSTTI